MTLELTMISWMGHQKHRQQQKKQRKWSDYIKVNCVDRKTSFIKDKNNRVKGNPKNWEKILANHVSDKGLMSGIYKVLL